MPIASVDDDVDICYETFGAPSDPTLVLVSGFTAQMIVWDEGFCRLLADAGRHVVRFDNRDCGLSTHFDGQHVDVAALLAAGETGQPLPAVPYGISAFCDDTFGLLDHLGVESAHIVGSSMGGMIVQQMAIERPERVLSMTSIMSTTGEPDYSESSPEAQAVLFAPPPSDRQEYIASSVDVEVWYGRRYFDEALVRERAAAAFDRAFYPEGASRQLGAIATAGDRAQGLRSLSMPCLVIHGVEDTLIMPKGGQRTAELIPGAHLLMMADMGHDLPRPLWPTITAAILATSA